MISDTHRALLKTHGLVVARTFIGLLFLVTGYGMFSNMGVGGVAGMLGGMGVPLAGLVAILVILVKILGGAFLIVGYKTDYAALGLLIFTLFTIVLVHNNAEELSAALKNLSIMGGLLYVLAYGPGEGWKICK